MKGKGLIMGSEAKPVAMNDVLQNLGQLEVKYQEQRNAINTGLDNTIGKQIEALKANKVKARKEKLDPVRQAYQQERKRLQALIVELQKKVAAPQ